MPDVFGLPDLPEHDLDGGSVAPQEYRAARGIDYSPEPQTYREPCRKCRGGQFISYSGRAVGSCFACKGLGYFERRTSSADRAKAKASRDARKARDAQESFDTFAAAQPAIWAWIVAEKDRFEFARAMHEALAKYGDLTERQLAACERCVAKAEARKAERSERVASAPAVNTDKLMAAFDAAARTGLKRPKMRFDGFQVSLAPAHGKNAGALYVKDGEQYLGKIVGGKFQRTRECDQATADRLAQAMIDPLAAAVAYGRRIGQCSCCGRTLTDPVSVANGIGPICAEGFGF